MGLSSLVKENENVELVDLANELKFIKIKSNSYYMSDSKQSQRVHTLYNYILTNVIEPKIGNTTTYADDLHKLGKILFGKQFIGVFASDKIPNNLKHKQSVILNVDKHGEPGSHWLGVVKHNDDLFVYDSFGRESKVLVKTLLKSGNGNVVDTDYDKEQTQNELNCGARSLSALVVYYLFGADFFLEI